MKFRARRHPTEFEIVLLVGDERCTLDVLDVSVQGLRVRQNRAVLEPEDDVTVEIRERHYPSRVTWTKNGEAGLEFDRPLPEELQALISRKSGPKKKRRFLFR